MLDPLSVREINKPWTHRAEGVVYQEGVREGEEGQDLWSYLLQWELLGDSSGEAV